jgi:hypothetical protein
VTNYCDWTYVPAESLANGTWPIVPLHLLEQSVERLEELVTAQR